MNSNSRKTCKIAILHHEIAVVLWRVHLPSLVQQYSRHPFLIDQGSPLAKEGLSAQFELIYISCFASEGLFVLHMKDLMKIMMIENEHLNCVQMVSCKLTIENDDIENYGV